MGRIGKLSGVLVLLLLTAGCRNSLQEYMETNLFGPPYYLEVAKLSAEGAIDFGFSVDMDGDYIIVGAPAESDNTTNPEAVYIYHRTAMDEWDSGFKIVPSDWQEGDRFGYSVAINGDYAVIGAYRKAVYNPSLGADQEAAGAAYIYKRTETNTWTEQVKLTQQDPWAAEIQIEARDYALFGCTVKMYGNWIFIAARQDDGTDAPDSSYGSVYAFKNTGTWTFSEMLTAGPGKESGAGFGWSLDVNGDYVAVGAPGEDIGGINKVGAVYLFQFLVDGWELDTRIIAPDGEVRDSFGMSVAVNNEYLTVAAPQKTVGGADFSGKVYIFEREDSGSWGSSPVAELTPDTPGENDFYGFPVAMHGDTLMAGCLFRDDAATDGGAVYIYNPVSGGGWELQKTLTPSDATESTYFGRSIVIGDTYAVIGATHTYEYHATGAVYLFR